jgi:hypothetical protein
MQAWDPSRAPPHSTRILPCRLTQDRENLEKLSELGVLFLLFEMGLELSLERLNALAKYAFGMGTLQMVICTAIFTAACLPVVGMAGSYSPMSEFLEDVANAPHTLVSISSLDEVSQRRGGAEQGEEAEGRGNWSEMEGGEEPWDPP